MCHKLTVIGVVIYPILLIMSIEAFVWRHSHHNTLNLSIVGAAESLDEAEETINILVLMDWRGYISWFEIIFECGGLLVIDNYVRFCHVFVILVLAVTGLNEFSFPYVGINLGDRDDVPWVSWFWLRGGSGWDGDHGRRHVPNHLWHVALVL